MNFDWGGTSVPNVWQAEYNGDGIFIARETLAHEPGVRWSWRWAFSSRRLDYRWRRLPDTVTTFYEAATMVAVLVRLEES